jgi:thymidylate kinase
MGTAYLPTPTDKLAYRYFAAFVPKSDIMFFIDIKPEEAYKRIMNRTHKAIEMFEKPDSLRKVRQKGLALASLGKWIIVDGGRSAPEVELTIRSFLNFSDFSRENKASN